MALFFNGYIITTKNFDLFFLNKKYDKIFIKYN